MTIAQTPFNSVFRKEREVRVFMPDAFEYGVIKHDPTVISANLFFSVQRLPDDKAKALEARGIVGRELKRLYGHVFMPMENEALVGFKPGPAEPTDFVFMDHQNQPRIALFYRPDFGAAPAATPGQRSPTCPAARVKIDGVWFEVVNRIEMLNGVLSNYEYHVARLPLDEQLSA
ncbi:putative head-completion protein [Pantoea phage vB_PagM_LIET2]|uniref:Putative head-completion protein n=1 Tax=Pantoea phage vB_PagM_LIET2 TaxID=2508071 RepID=A0A411AW49_9CAUD|nr:putative head-completion protein [Pantoea phage vB_PagM_LIET2]QAX92332.1 putative head-completion protein [Pantoea phage vB_PagM_LIET2]